MDLQLKGKTAIVTGGTAGIGLAIARVLSEEGVRVTIPGRDEKKLNEALASLPGGARGVVADLGTAAGAARLIAEVPDTDILVNNLGIYQPRPTAVQISLLDRLSVLESLELVSTSAF
jgi:NAD(P)-dependent dehydrogenase (short-subunit alcohol dehydrogenase family)